MAWDGTARDGMAWDGIARDGMACESMAWHETVHGIANQMAWHGMAWDSMGWHGTVRPAWLEGACALKEVCAKRRKSCVRRLNLLDKSVSCPLATNSRPPGGGPKPGTKVQQGKVSALRAVVHFWGGVFGASFENQNYALYSSACGPRPNPRASTHALLARHKRDAFRQRLPEHGSPAPAAKVQDGHAEQALELRCNLSQSRFEFTAQALQGQPQNLLLLRAWFLQPAQALAATRTGFPRCVVLRVL